MGSSVMVTNGPGLIENGEPNWLSRYGCHGQSGLVLIISRYTVGSLGV